MEFEGEMMEMTEALMYADDSICVKYSDGSSLQLSPCGSVFSYQGTTARPHMTQQLTRFAISMYKEKVCEAVTLRNRFACRAYLCKGFLPQKQIMVSVFKTFSHPLSQTNKQILYFTCIGTELTLNQKSK